MPIIALVSGGLDSFIMYRFLSEQESVIPLFIHYDGRYNNKEYKAAKFLFGDNLVVDYSLNLARIENGEKAFIQNRNAYFALVASNYGNRIAMGGLKDDNVGDKSPIAFLKMTELLNTINNTDKFNVFSPFWNKEKVEIIDWYLKAYFSPEILGETISCYSADTTNYCGTCPACFRRYCAFKWHDLPIPKFTNLDLVKKYADEWEKKKGKRAKSIKQIVTELLK